MVQAKAVARSKLVAVVKELYNDEYLKSCKHPGHKCCETVRSLIKERVWAKAVAFAKAHVTIEAQVTTKGKASGCTGAKAEALARATATLKIFVDAVAGVYVGHDVEEARAKFQASFKAIAEAFAAAALGVCASGDSHVNAGIESFSTGFASVSVDLLVFLHAQIGCKGSGSAEHVQLKDSPTTSTKSTTNFYGDAEGTAYAAGNGFGSGFAKAFEQFDGKR